MPQCNIPPKRYILPGAVRAWGWSSTARRLCLPGVAGAGSALVTMWPERKPLNANRLRTQGEADRFGSLGIACSTGHRRQTRLRRFLLASRRQGLD
jgi:hypothetical protein